MIRSKQLVLAVAAALALGGGTACTPRSEVGGSGSMGSAAAGSMADAGSADTGSATVTGSSVLAGSAPVEAEAGSVQDGAPSTEAEAPAAPTEPVAQHDFDCEWFYLDVPDSWVRDDAGTPVADGPTLWGVTAEGPSVYHFWRSRQVGTEPDGYPIYETGALDVYVGGDTGYTGELYGYTVGNTPVYTSEASAPFLATEYAEGAVLTLKEGDAPANVTDEASFVATARAALNVPDDPAITYEISEPLYWSGGGTFVTRIYFYKNGEVVAGALCNEDGTPARDILSYTG